VTRGVKSGIFVIAPIEGEVGEHIATLQRTYDPRILKLGPPHVTIIGSSGAGPVAPTTPVDELRRKITPIALDTPPIAITFQPPMRFMQTEIVVLPLDPHGALRELHERLKTSGLPYAKPRFYFTPHVTLNLYRELPRDLLNRLLLERFPETVMLRRIECHLTTDSGDSTLLVEIPLGSAQSAKS
jgi:2'-5' RNA ligase